ncbi:MAG: mediator of RNA polymerase II transcription subunit 8 [Sclerophora amabilis]|nr:MAG: mediator of RNA polymerase II transcription subunit 8 [Sclerophora amabilis]
MNALTPQDLKVLEQTRQRLFQLTNAIGSLQAQIISSAPLPPWSVSLFLLDGRALGFPSPSPSHPSPVQSSPVQSSPFHFYQFRSNADSLASMSQRPSLQSRASVISQMLYMLSRHLGAHTDLLAAMSVYPLPQFPGKARHGLLQQLLRKKLEPGVEEWVEQGREEGNRYGFAPAAAPAATDGDAGGHSGGKGGAEMERQDDAAVLTALWDWAPGMMAQHRKRRALKRKLGMDMDDEVESEEDDVDDDDDEDDEDADMEDANEERQEASRAEAGEEGGETGHQSAGEIRDEGSDKPEQHAQSGGEPRRPTRPLRMEELMRFMSTGTMPAAMPTA